MREVYGGVRRVTCAVRDLAATRAFYATRLGFALVDEAPGHWIEVNVATFRLRFVPATESAPPAGRGLELTFRVDRLADTASELDTRKVPYAAYTSRRGRDYLEVHDPDGHRIVFTERV